MALFKQGRDQRLPLYQQVRDELLENISAGTWLPDAPIPTESELTKPMMLPLERFAKRSTP